MISEEMMKNWENGKFVSVEQDTVIIMQLINEVRDLQQRVRTLREEALSWRHTAESNKRMSDYVLDTIGVKAGSTLPLANDKARERVLTLLEQCVRIEMY